jgi:hypothetical protein
MWFSGRTNHHPICLAAIANIQVMQEDYIGNMPFNGTGLHRMQRFGEQHPSIGSSFH